MSVLRIVAIVAMLAAAAMAQGCPATPTYFSRTTAWSCGAFANIENALCKCAGLTANTTASQSCYSGVVSLGVGACGNVVNCINMYFAQIEVAVANTTNGCTAFGALWTTGVLNGVLSNPTNFSMSPFAAECGAAVCQITQAITGSYCWAQVGGGAYPAVCGSFSVYGTTTNATNMTTTATTTKKAGSGGGSKGSNGGTTTTTTTAAPTPKSAAVQTTTLLAVVAAIAAVASL